MQKIWFCLVCQPRSGSSLLTSSLRLRQDIMMHDEILNENSDDIMNCYTHAYKTLLSKEDGRRRILEAYFDCPNTCEAVGCKIHITQPRDTHPHWENAWRVLEAHEDIKIISLQRRDVLAQLASSKIAIMTNSFGNQEHIKERPIIRIENNELIDFNSNLLKLQQSRLGSINPSRIYSVYYEDLVSNWQVITSEILEFIGVSKTPNLYKALKKQENRPLEEIIINYADFR